MHKYNRIYLKPKYTCNSKPFIFSSWLEFTLGGIRVLNLNVVNKCKYKDLNSHIQVSVQTRINDNSIHEIEIIIFS